jgi:7-cyano-7-deazaguanine synthase
MSRVNKKSVVLLSGGLDSATTLAIAKSMGFQCYALTFHYGQRHACEVKAAKKVARSLGVVEHRIIDIDLTAFGGSALTDRTIKVPKNRPNFGKNVKIPLTYVPARNIILLSYALAWAEVLGAWEIFIGVNAVDYSGYPDCRPAFISAFEKAANLGIAASVEGKGKYTGTKLGLDYSLTHSCYDPDAKGRACGRCDSCRLRLKGFAEAGLKDPGRYKDEGN